jgi:hypothetical protein
MIANPAIPHPAALPQPFSLNDLRPHTAVAEEPSSNSALNLSGLILAVVLAIGAFIWLDPLHLFSPTEASPPAPAIVPSAEPARPIERQEIIAPLAPVPATKSVEAPIAPPPVVQAPHVQAPVIPAPAIRPRAANTKPESGGNRMDSTNSTVLKATPMEKMAPPVLLSKPEEMATPPALPTKPAETTDAPIVLKPSDETGNAPKPAAAKDPTPVTE